MSVGPPSCTSCQAAIVEGAAFCGVCGTPVGWECTSCATQNAAAHRFCVACGTPRTAAEPVPTDLGRTPERRRLTMLFCDMVGSTNLADRLDAEEFATLVIDLQHRLERCVAEQGGHVANFMGDGLLAFFGVPEAFGDDAVRGVAAGLAMVDAVGDGELRVRVGIHTGIVLVGDFGTLDGQRRLDALGLAPAVAARVQSEAEPNTVFLTEDTWELVRGFVVAEPVGERSLKGVSEPMKLHRAMSLTGARDRIEAETPRQGPFVGRAAEMGLIADAVRRSAGGVEAIVVLGESGIGKSRLLRAAIATSAPPDHRLVVLRGRPDRSSTPLSPLIEVLKVGDDERATASASRLLAAGLLDDESVESTAASAGERRRRTIEACLAWIVETATEASTSLVVEDAQWIDPSTLSVLNEVLASDSLPLLVAVTARPEFSWSWPARARVRQLTLSRLSTEEIHALVKSLPGADRLHSDTVEHICRRSEGVPLFVEELTYVMARSDGSTPSEVPALLHDILRARLDSVAGARDVANAVAVLGRDAEVEQLEALVRAPITELARQADLLVTHGVFEQHGGAVGFRHGLLRDATYEAMSLAERCRLHRVVADAITGETAGFVASEEELARHYEGAAMVDEAITTWCRAGLLAEHRAALHEALDHYGRALDLVDRLPEGPAKGAREVDVLMRLARPTHDAHGPLHPSYRMVLERLRRIAEPLDDPMWKNLLAGVEVTILTAQPERVRAEALLDDMLAANGETAGRLTRLNIHSLAGIAASLWGERTRAVAEFQQVTELYDPDRPLPEYDPGLFAMIHHRQVMLELGRTDDAAQLGAVLESSIERAGPYTRAISAVVLAAFAAVADDVVECSRWVEVATDAARNRGFTNVDARLGVVRHIPATFGGSPGSATAVLQSALRDYPLGQPRSGVSAYLTVLASGWLRAEHYEEAELAIGELIAFADRTGEAQWRPYASVLAARVALRSGEHDRGIALLHDAVDRASAARFEWCRHRAQILLGDPGAA